VGRGQGNPPSFLEVTAGGQVSNFRGYLGYRAGSRGTATVTGAGATWTISDGLHVGYKGTGTLTVEAGGKVSSRYGLLGSNDGSRGTATVTGDGATWMNSGPWPNSGDLCVGKSGTGTLTVEAGGKVSNWNGYLGYEDGGQGTATVTGAGATWTSRYSLYVGYRGTGTLNVEAGGRVLNSSGYLGYEDGTQGAATVTGAGSAWTNSGSLYVGRWGIGTLNVEAGGQVSSRDGYLGHEESGWGTATVTGAGSAWTISRDLYVSHVGTGSLAVRDGGRVSSGNGYLGRWNGAQGMATVTGAGSAWTNSGDLFVGRDGTGSLEVRDGGQVIVGGFLRVGRRGSLTLAGGTLDAWTISPDIAAMTTFRAGTLRFRTYEGSLTNAGCTLGSPDFWYGLTVTGDYTQGPEATLLVEIDGLPESGQFDVLSIGGTADLAGTLALDFSLAPPAGTEYEFLRAAAISGTFDDFVVTGLGPRQWVEFDVPAGRFTVLPEPGALALLAGGLLALARRRR